MTSTLEQLARAAASSRTRQVVEIPVEKIEPDPSQPRKEFREIEELAASIRALGIQQPLLVREHPEKPERYVLIAGERRYRAAIESGLTTVPCLLEAGGPDDTAPAPVTQLVENLQRSDLTILEIANALRKVLEETGLPKKELARLLGKRPNFVSKHLALLDAKGDIRLALEDGLITSPETFRLLGKMSKRRRAQLLGVARSEGRPVPRGRVVAVAAQESPKARRRSPRQAPTEEDARYRIPPLTEVQLRRIVEALGASPPDEPTRLVAALLELI